MDGYKYNENSLAAIAEQVQKDGTEYLSQYMGTYSSYDIIDKKIVRFTANNYKGYYLRTKITIGSNYRRLNSIC